MIPAPTVEAMEAYMRRAEGADAETEKWCREVLEDAAKQARAMDKLKRDIGEALFHR